MKEIDYPWCKACHSWHHSSNPNCRRKERKVLRFSETVLIFTLLLVVLVLFIALRSN